MKLRVRAGIVMVVFGLRGSGKSTLVNNLCESVGSRALVYDTLSEVPPDAPYDHYIPRDRQSVAELEAVIKRLQHNKYRLFVVDEANRFAPSKPSPIPHYIGELNDIGRHPPYRLMVIYIARRPVSLNQDITELADYIACFRLTGKNDVAYLNSIADGFGSAVRGLKPYQFMLADSERSLHEMRPVNPIREWLRRAKSR